MMDAFHASGFHHGDLRPQNVCVDADGRLRLIDLSEVEKCPCRGTDCKELKELAEESGRPV